MTDVAVTRDYVDDEKTFEDFNLDPRLIQAINRLGFEHPTLIQSQAIRLSLEEKKDIIAKANTGSGKTGAYCIPIVQSILTDTQKSNATKSVVLVPTKELANQVTSFLNDLIIYCGREIRCMNLNDQVSDRLLKSILNEKPEILISTPARLITILENQKINLMDLKYLVIDEVDLMLGYGYNEDLDKLTNYLNLKQSMQIFMMSATLSDELNELKAKFCNKPVVLKLQDVDNQAKRLNQYYIKMNELDKFLYIYVILKLNLLKGKIIIFVNDLDRGYKLKLFLNNFGIRTCILNSELPINSRLHIVDEFNKNVYNLLIATDESNEYDEEADNEDKPSKGKKKDNDYSVSRGVDFKNVACVLNFDLPTSSKAYVHRVGRTARGGKSGIALSFVVLKSEFGKHKWSSCPTARKDEKVLARVEKMQKKLGYSIEPYQLDTKQLDNFRYRMEDSFRSVTKTAVREARLKEIKLELMQSEKLKRHFEENPQDLISLRHDRDLSRVRTDSHLKHVPDYLLPPGARSDPKKLGFVPFAKGKKKRQAKKGGVRKSNPLKKFRK